MNHLKRPRHYAAEIMQINDREGRRQALEKVPAELQSWVKTLVINAYEIRAAGRDRKKVR